jgi:hypothetical protein
MARSFKDVPTKDLLPEDQTYRSSLERDPTPLVSSLRRMGVLIPLRLQEAGEGFRIVSGFLRAEAAMELGQDTVPAEVLGTEEPRETLLAALHENNLTRGFTWPERTWVLERVMKQWDVPRDWILEELLPAMGLPPAPRALEDHLNAASIHPDLRRVLLRHGCSLANALRLGRMQQQDQEFFVALLPSLHLGENLLRECLELLWETSTRDGISPRQILSDAKLLEAMEARGQDRPQRAAVLREHLLRARMPHLSSMQEAFRKARKGLGLPSRISLQHNPFFESPGVTVGFTARTSREFVHISRRLWEASQRSELLAALFHSTISPHPVVLNPGPQPGDQG